MDYDVKCPYCTAGQEINHDDGQGYAEDEIHEQECYNCEKTFVFYTSISFYYDVSKADCLNGAEHPYKKAGSYPDPFPDHIRCTDCGHEIRGTYHPEIMENYFKEIDERQAKKAAAAEKA